MKIIYIVDFFHPDAGYQVNIMAKYWSLFGNEVIVISSELKKLPSFLTDFFDCSDIEKKDSLYENNNKVKIIRVPIIAYKSGRSIYTGKIFKLIKEIKPDIVFVNGNDTLIGMQLIRRQRRAPYVLVSDNHMLEMASENPFRKVYRFIYKNFYTPIIIKENIPVIRTVDDPYVEKCLGIPLNRCPVISFGTDTLLFHPDENQKVKFRKENNISQSDFVVLYAGKLSRNKGIDILAEVVDRKISEKRKITFIVIGNSSGEFGEFIEKRFSESKNRVIRFSTQTYQNLCYFYQAADIAVYPKECSLSFYDVQACGLPVVFENNNINIDRSAYGSAVVFQSGDIEDMVCKIRMLSEMTESEILLYSKRAVEFITSQYEYKDKAKEYLELFQSKINEKEMI